MVSHITIISENRDIFESRGADIKEAKAFVKKGYVEKLTASEEEVVMARCTLKSWKNLLHVYGGGASEKKRRKGRRHTTLNSDTVLDLLGKSP